MSGILFPGGKAPKVAGFKIQTSVYGLPIPMVYGAARIAANLIHMPKTPALVNGRGKSITTKGANSGNDYTAPMILALCEGELLHSIGNVWRDKDAFVPFSTYAAQGWAVFAGSVGQAAWSYLTTNYPTQALKYQSIAYVANPATVLPNDSLSSYGWEILGALMWNFGGGIVDASPADIIPDYLTNARYGLGFPSAQIGSLTQFQDYCAAFSLFCAPAFTSQQPAREQLNELLEIANTGAVWSDGVLKFVPYGDVAATANGHTYTPNTTPLYDLGDNDYLPRGGDIDPVLVTRKDPAHCFNQVPVEYEDRSYEYNVNTVKAEDQESLLANGPRTMPTMALHAIKTAAVAQQVGWMRLQREQNVRNTYQFRLGWRFALLEPMDLVTLTDTKLGLSLTPVRITTVQELDNEQGYEFTAEDWPFGTASATRYSTASNSGTATNANVSPGNTSAPIIFDGPAALATGAYEIWIAAAGGATWGGCEVWLSTDNSNFMKVGTIIGKSAYGELTATLATDARYPAIDTTHTLSVDVTTSGGVLAALSQAQFDMLAFPCWVNGEFLSYRDLALTSAFHYDLTHLYRGLYTTPISTHIATDSFVFCDDHIARIPWPQAAIGQTLYVKLPAFNIFGGAQQDVSSVSSTAFAIGQDSFGRHQASPQITVSIDVGGSWSATADGPNNAQSYKWLASTSAFPADVTVQSFGTVVNGRSFSVVAGGTLTPGQTIFLTAIPYTYPNAGGLALPSVHGRGSYQNAVTGKFDTFAAAALIPRDTTAPQFTVDLTTGGIVVVPGANPIKPNGTVLVKVTSGLTLDSLQMYAFSNSAHVPPSQEQCAIGLIAINRATQAQTFIASVVTGGQSAAVQFAQTTGIGHTVDTSTYAYYIYAWLNDAWGDGGVTCYNFTLGYVQNNYTQGM